MSTSGGGERRETSGKTLFGVWCAILLLGVFSLVMRFAHIGSFSFLVGFAVAVVQVALLGLFFMELVHEAPTVWFAFATCLALFSILLTFVVADVITRPTAPLENPPGTAARYRG